MVQHGNLMWPVTLGLEELKKNKILKAKTINEEKRLLPS